MQSIQTLQLPASAVTILLALASLDAAPQTSVCTREQGAPVQTSIGMDLCSGTAQAPVATYDAPQPGARIAAVPEGSLAHEAGLRAGDVIYQVAGQRVQSGTAAAENLARARTAGAVVINFWRDGRMYLVRLWLDTK